MRTMAISGIVAVLLSHLLCFGTAFDMTTGYATTCAVNQNAVKCWGYNSNGQLGLGHTTNMDEPQDTPIDLGDDFVPATVTCGFLHCCSVSEAGGLKCWGLNSYGQLGYGDNDYRGDDANEMGTNLTLVNLGTGFIVDHIMVYGFHTCAMSTQGDIKCFGRNDYGQLGYGDTDRRGDGSGEMGDALGVVDLGDFDAVKLIVGGYLHTCAQSEGELKCWGMNQYGQLGQGDANHRGDVGGEMGDFLLPIDLGSAFVAPSVKCAASHCCALNAEHGFKCWGYNYAGGLGYGDTDNRGDNSEEMGDYLPVVDMGSEFIVDDFVAIVHSTCVSSADVGIKCFGWNNLGQLGYGDTKDRGDNSEEMGDYLPVVDMGSELNASGMHLIGNGQSRHYCVYEESGSSEILVKCWGFGAKGQLGYGDTKNRGDGSGEMGANLPLIDLGTWPVVTTNAPTMEPTVSPTVKPTAQPSTEPTDPICDAAGMTAVNWHDLLNSDEQDVSLLQSYAVDFDASTLSLTFKASVEYVGRSADGNFDDDFNLGTSYWIDFQSFSSIDGGIDSVGNCANRRSTDYTDLSFGQFWNYTVNPMQLELVSTAERMAYPPSDWNLTASSCNAVEFERTFSWTQLTECIDADYNGLIDVTETADAITLSGVFFVELVSPYSMSSDGYYRTFPMIQQDFAIVLDRQVDALASTGVQLFISTVMAYGRDDDGNYELTILVQSADYVKLGTGNDVTLIDGPWDTSDIETVTGDGCLVASSFTCGQIFTATIPAECSADDNTVDLSGTYQFSFDPDCQTLDDGSDDAACTTFLGTVGEAGVVLDVVSSFTDNCDVDLFNVTFGADLTFYQDDAFTVEVGDDSDPYVIGQDTIYGKVLVDIAVDETDTMYTFVGVSIENIYVCTAEDTADLSLDSDSGIGGCLSSNIDADGPYVVYGDGAVTDYNGMTYDATGNEATFSFLTFDTPRTTINVHVQLLLTLVTDTGARRRMLLEADIEEGNAFRSFIGTASVQEEDTTVDPVGTDGAAKVSAGFIAAMFVFTAYIMG